MLHNKVYTKIFPSAKLNILSVEIPIFILISHFSFWVNIVRTKITSLSSIRIKSYAIEVSFLIRIEYLMSIPVIVPKPSHRIPNIMKLELKHCNYSLLSSALLKCTKKCTSAHNGAYRETVPVRIICKWIH